MKMKLKSHLMVEFRLIRDIGYTFGEIVIVLRLRQQIKDFHTLKGISDNQGRLYPQLARTGGLVLYRPFEYNPKGNQENCHIILLFLGWNISC